MPLGQKQSVETLNFLLYSRVLHPELFEIYHSQQIIQPGYEASLWITGCSHLVSFSVDTSTLTEVMAEEHDVLPERGLVACFRVRGEKQHEYHNDLGVRYMMNLQVETMSPKLYEQTHQDLTVAAGRHGLYVPFPQWQEHELPPFTYVDYQTTPESLHIFAYHAFPEALTLVKTQSLFELPKFKP